jgi:hypothetical protein
MPEARNASLFPALHRKTEATPFAPPIYGSSD